MTFNNTNNILKHINQYTTDVVNNYSINKVSNLKKKRIICVLMMPLLKNIIPYTYTNGDINVTKI